jgi:cell division septum initiation protein DivIVA
VNPKERPSLPRPLATSTAERIAVIVEAAERAASSVIDDAEEQARRYLDEARADADRIVAERLRAVADELDPPLAGEQPPRLRSVGSPAPGEEPARTVSARRSDDGSSGARLLATQMAVSGSSREEIAARLRSGFEIEDANGILDAILGPET